MTAALILSTVIPGQPVQWQRARGGHGGGDASDGRGRQQSFFTAPAMKRYKAVVQDYGRLAMLEAKARGAEHRGKPIELGKPVIFDAQVYIAIPASFTRAEDAQARAGMLRPTGKPDLDNWIKLPMDALEGIAYANDSQVVGFGRSGVWYAEKPRLEIRVTHAPLRPRPADRDLLARRLAWLETTVEGAIKLGTTLADHPGFSDSDGTWDAVELVRCIRSMMADGSL